MYHEHLNRNILTLINCRQSWGGRNKKWDIDPRHLSGSYIAAFINWSRVLRESRTLTTDCSSRERRSRCIIVNYLDDRPQLEASRQFRIDTLDTQGVTLVYGDTRWRIFRAFYSRPLPFQKQKERFIRDIEKIYNCTTVLFTERCKQYIKI